jgi:DNA protecting protein DprA
MTKSTLSRHLPSANALAFLYLFDSLRGFGPQKFRQLHESSQSLEEILREPGRLAMSGKRGDSFREQLNKIGQDLLDKCFKRAEKQLSVAASTQSLILTYADSLYPKRVFNSNNPTPVIYVRGNPEILASMNTVACVGSRNIREPYASLHADFARAASHRGFTIVSGFAVGADTLGHKAAVEGGGKTICVMPSGLDRPFPPENRELWKGWLSNPHVVFVSEFPFGTGAAKLNLRKRNKLIVAFAKGVLVSQSSKTGGAMNAYRFALEQRKPIATFRDDGKEDTSGNHEIQLGERQQATVLSLNPNEIDAREKWLQALSSST